MEFTIDCKLDEMKEKFLNDIRASFMSNPSVQGKVFLSTTDDISFYAITEENTDDSSEYKKLTKFQVRVDAKWK